MGLFSRLWLLFFFFKQKPENFSVVISVGLRLLRRNSVVGSLGFYLQLLAFLCTVYTFLNEEETIDRKGFLASYLGVIIDRV